MSRTKLLLDVVEDLKKLAESMEALADAMAKDGLSSETQSENSGKKDSPAIVSIEQVRKVLTDKYESGKKDAVRELIKKFGGTKLTDVDPAKYPEILKEAASL